MAGEMSEQALQELAASFEIFDETNSGYVSAERMTLLIRGTGEAPTEAQIAEVVQKANENGGKVSFEEFVNVIKKFREDGSRPKLTEVESAFRVFDPSASGYLHRDELKRVLTSFGEKLSEEEADGLIAVADVDEEGRIDYARFARKLMS